MVGFPKPSGDLIKSLCLVKQVKNNVEARAICSSHGMSLFKIDSTFVKKPFLNAMGAFFPASTNPATRLFIGGPSTGKKCTAIDNVPGDFQVILTTCTDSMYFVCQMNAEAGVVAPTSNSQICSAKVDFTRTPNIVIKSFCLVRNAQTNTEASNTCNRHGMSLFIVDPHLNQLFFNAMDSFFPASTNPATRLFVAGPSFGNSCAAIDNVPGIFQFINTTCTDSMYFVCQFNSQGNEI